MSERVLISSGFLTALSAGLVSHVAASTLYDSGGFEPSAGYTLGYLQGQPSGTSSSNSWLAATTSDQDVEASVFQYSNAAQNPSNQQGVLLSDESSTGGLTASGDSGYFFPGTYYSSAFNPNGGSVTVSWEQSYASGAQNYPFFGVIVYSGTKQIAGFGADAEDNQFVYYSGAGAGEFTADGQAPSAGSFGTYAITLNYLTGTFDIYYNGVELDSTSLSFINSPAAGGNTFSNADLASFAVTGSGGFYGFGYVDNYLVTYVPEPASMGLMAGGTLMLLRRRRTKRTG